MTVIVKRPSLSFTPGVKVKENIIPIYANCRKFRGGDSYWQSAETWLTASVDVRFSHGLCPTGVKAQDRDSAAALAEKAERPPEECGREHEG